MNIKLNNLNEALFSFCCKFAKKGKFILALDETDIVKHVSIANNHVIGLDKQYHLKEMPKFLKSVDDICDIYFQLANQVLAMFIIGVNGEVLQLIKILFIFSFYK